MSDRTPLSSQTIADTLANDQAMICHLQARIILLEDHMADTRSCVRLIIIALVLLTALALAGCYFRITHEISLGSGNEKHPSAPAPADGGVR